MSIVALLVHRMDVQTLPATVGRDASGGIIDTPDQWATLTSSVPCARNPVSAQRQMAFAVAGVQITDVIVTLQPGILAGMRLVFVDGGVTVYLRVDSVRFIPGRGTIPGRYEIMAEEVRQA